MALNIKIIEHQTGNRKLEKYIWQLTKKSKYIRKKLFAISQRIKDYYNSIKFSTKNLV